MSASVFPAYVGMSPAQTEHILRALSLAVGHHVAFERALVLAFRYDGDTGAAAEFLGIPRRTVQWSQQLVRKFGVVIARALTVRAAREEYGKAHEPVTVGELMWCLPQGVPRIRGDEPIVLGLWHHRALCSPHTWG